MTSYSEDMTQVTETSFGIVEKTQWDHDNPHNLIGIKFFDDARRSTRDYRYECFPTNSEHFSFKVFANNATKVVR
jgi:hypothetical protein